MENIVNGNDLMLYVDQSENSVPGAVNDNPSWKATACATSHQITFNAETKERTTKDSSGAWKGKSVVGKSVSIKCDALVSRSDSKLGYNELLALAKAGKPVRLKYSYTQAAAGETYSDFSCE